VGKSIVWPRRTKAGGRGLFFPLCFHSESRKGGSGLSECMRKRLTSGKMPKQDELRGPVGRFVVLSVIIGKGVSVSGTLASNCA